MSPELSVVVPIYNELDSLPELLSRLAQSLSVLSIRSEILIVDDASTDGSCGLLLEWADSKRSSQKTTHPPEPPVEIAEGVPDSPADSSFKQQEGTIERRVLALPRNQGQYGATRAGLANARGRWVAVLDGDLQDPPELIPELFEAARQSPEVEVIFAVKSERGDPWFLRLAQGIFHGLQSWLSQSPYQKGAGSYCLIDGDLARKLGQVPIANANLASVLTLLDANKSSVAYAKSARQHGSSRVGPVRLVHEALESMLLTGALERVIIPAAVGLALAGVWTAQRVVSADPQLESLASGLVWSAILLFSSWLYVRRRRKKLSAPLAELSSNLHKQRRLEHNQG